MIVKSWGKDDGVLYPYGLTKEYFDDYIGNNPHFDYNINLFNTGVTSLGKLEMVRGHLGLEGTKITSLGKLEHVGRYLSLEGAELGSLGNLKHVGEVIYCTEGSDTHELLMNSKFVDQVEI